MTSSRRSSSLSPSSSEKDDDTDDDEKQSTNGDIDSEPIDNNNDEGRRRRQLRSYVSKLETIYDNDLIPYILDGQINYLAELFPSWETTIDDTDESTQREQGRRQRVILRDWLNHQEEGDGTVVCVGDSCGDDSEVSLLLLKILPIKILPNIFWFSILSFHILPPSFNHLCTNYSPTSNVKFLKNTR
jgi:hypothetical protein